MTTTAAPTAPSGHDPAWYSLPPEAVAQRPGVDPARGLSAAEAAQRRQQHGPNRLAANSRHCEPMALSHPLRVGLAAPSTAFFQDREPSCANLQHR
jgi:Cation transporter/ATPase, N-terminus